MTQQFQCNYDDRDLPYVNEPVEELPNRRSLCLQTAERLVNHDRNTQYDDPQADFRIIAGLWTVYLRARFGITEDVAKHDIAAMMSLLKLARISHQPENFDSWVDLAGYAACGWDVAEDAK
jgi:hypothetical protein